MFYASVKRKNGELVFDMECKDYEMARAILYEYLQNHGYVVNECSYDVYRLDNGEYFGYIYQ